MIVSPHPRVGVLLFFSAGAWLILGCNTPQAGGQTGDENRGVKCWEIPRTPVSPDTPGPGGFSAAESLKQLRLVHATSVELPSAEWSREPAELKGSSIATITVNVDANGWRVEDYARTEPDDAAATCDSKLATESHLAITIDGDTVVDELQSGFVLDSETYAQLEAKVSSEAIAGYLQEAIRTEGDGDKLTFVGGVTALSTWGRLSLVDSAGVEPDKVLIAWPRSDLCEQGGFPVSGADAEAYLAAYEQLAVRAATSDGLVFEQEWRLRLDAESSCLIPRTPGDETDMLAVAAALEVVDVETGAASSLAAVLRIPAMRDADRGFELSVIGPCASLGMPHPETFVKACGDWKLDTSAYGGAHLELVARLSTEKTLDGHVKIFGDPSPSCVESGTVEQSDQDQPSVGSCGGTDSVLIGELELAGKYSQ